MARKAAALVGGLMGGGSFVLDFAMALALVVAFALAFVGAFTFETRAGEVSICEEALRPDELLKGDLSSVVPFLFALAFASVFAFTFGFAFGIGERISGENDPLLSGSSSSTLSDERSEP